MASRAFSRGEIFAGVELQQVEDKDRTVLEPSFREALDRGGIRIDVVNPAELRKRLVPFVDGGALDVKPGSLSVGEGNAGGIRGTLAKGGDRHERPKREDPRGREG